MRFVFISLTLLFAVAALAEEEDELVVEVEENAQLSDVFVPTTEWQRVAEGQPIPRGLHVRINLETGLKEAKLMDGSKFTGDQRRAHHHGHTDRRGIINKRSKVFARGEYMEMLRENNVVESSHPPALTHLTGGDTYHPPTVTHLTTDTERPHTLPVTLHPEMVSMLELTGALSDPRTPVTELVSVLEELEYLVHQIDNGQDLVSLGGLSVVLRLLNHSSETVRAEAALVIGAAAQSNPVVQEEVVLLGGVPALCALLAQSELLQRRALFAVGAVLRGSPSHQTLAICPEFSDLQKIFHERSERVKLKVITLVTDLANVLVDSEEWCEQASSLLYSTDPGLVEAGLNGIVSLGCEYTNHLSMLRKLMSQFTENSELVESCQLLLANTRQEL